MILSVVFAVLIAAIERRDTFSGPGWESWRSLLAVFGPDSEFDEIRRLWRFANTTREATSV